MADNAQSENGDALYFRFFNEIGIIDQLATTALASTLPAGFLPSHFGVLNHLSRNPAGRTPLFLAKAFQVPKNTMTHTLSGLLKHGLAEQKPHPRDGRSKVITITPAGLQFMDEALKNVRPVFENFAENFPPDMIAKLIPALEDIRIFMDEDRNKDDFGD